LSLGIGFAKESGGVWGTIFVFGLLFFGDGFVGRDYPVEAGVFIEGGLDEASVAGKKRHDGSEKIGSVLGSTFLNFASFDLLE
jgi:hypothetical protein